MKIDEAVDVVLSLRDDAGRLEVEREALADVAMTDRATLAALAQTWRGAADDLAESNKSEGYDPVVPVLRCCANQLEAALAAPPVPEGEMRTHPLLDQWPIQDVLRRLADAVDHLLHDHDCDHLGHEGDLYAMQAARMHADLMTPRRAAPAVGEEKERVDDSHS